MNLYSRNFEKQTMVTLIQHFITDIQHQKNCALINFRYNIAKIKDNLGLKSPITSYTMTGNTTFFSKQDHIKK